MQRSKCKNANPKKVETLGFSRCPNPGFGFGKMSGLPGYPGFLKTRGSIPSTRQQHHTNEGDGRYGCGGVRCGPVRLIVTPRSAYYIFTKLWGIVCLHFAFIVHFESKVMFCANLSAFL